MSVSYRWNPYEEQVRAFSTAAQGLTTLPAMARNMIFDQVLNSSELPASVKQVQQHVFEQKFNEMTS